MRCICFTALLCLSTWPVSVCGAPPNRQHIIDQQQHLIKAQQADDQVRQSVEKVINQLRTPYGDVSGLRIASDQLSHLNRARDSRAAQFWELLGITVPLQHPLADSPRAELESFLGTFKDTARGSFASTVLNEHNLLTTASKARTLLAKLQLKSTTEERSEAQFTQLIEIDKDFSTTDSAAVGRRYLRAHYNRRSREVAGEAGLLTPEVAERLASQRLTEAQKQYGHPRDKNSLRQALVEIVEDYPRTQTGQQASAQLIDVQKALNAEAERTRSIRDYWDAVYPSRIGAQR